MALLLLRSKLNNFFFKQPNYTSTSVWCRHYALSRFPERHPGVGRARPNLTSKRDKEDVNNTCIEDDHSQLDTWAASQVRPPANDTKKGLERLLLENNTLIITRQIEMLNLFVGFEQSNRYVITNEQEETLGYIAEEPRGFLATFGRQIFRTHRPFRAIVMDAAGAPILWIRRPFAWINSRMFVQRLKGLGENTPDGEPILDTFAEVLQRWHAWRRRYDLFLLDDYKSGPSEHQSDPSRESFFQFSRIDEGFWAWHFTLRDFPGNPIAHVDRAFRGLGREIFTDTGRYVVRFTPQESDSYQSPHIIRNLDLEERALVLAMAVNIDFDYFSRHSGGGHGWMYFGSWE